MLKPAAGKRAVVSRACCCPIVELRQYTLHPGRLEGFVQLFEREFIDPQEAAGMRVIGQFRDLDDPDRFVWLRGFADMPSRAQALEAFYGGPVWQTHREAANANFIDTDNVLLLHPVAPQSGFVLADLKRALRGTAPSARDIVLITVYPLKSEPARVFGDFFRAAMLPALARAGIDVAAQLETETAANTFPRLPVRTGGFVFVWVARFPDRAGSEAALARLTASELWRDTIAPALARQLAGPSQVLRLGPTPRSLWPGRVQA